MPMNRCNEASLNSFANLKRSLIGVLKLCFEKIRSIESVDHSTYNGGNRDEWEMGNFVTV